MNRPTKDEYYLNIAKAVSARSTCTRRQYGAVIVKNDRIVSTGYNGAASGAINCCDTGECYRETNNIPHGERYELCTAVHAEQNAIIGAGRTNTLDATLYLWGGQNGKEINAQPCRMCGRIIKNAGIKNVVGSKNDTTDKPTDPFADDIKMAHGHHWIVDSTHNGEPYCSCCGEEALIGDRTAFCPNCGARMDGEE